MFPQLPNYSPDNPPSGSSSTESEPQGLEDTIEFLGGDDEPETLEIGKDKTPPSDSKEDKEGAEEGKEIKEDEEDELKELEEEIKGPPEDKLELVTPVRRQEILKKYPTLFKDFPYLESAYYRDQQFTEMFGTIKEAQEVHSKAEILDRLESEVFSGNTENILKTVKDENPEGFYKLVDDYLPTLARVDERAYMHLLGNVTKHTIVAMVKESRDSGNEALQNAAALLNQFVFGTTRFTPAQNLSRQQNPQQTEQDTELQQREQAFMQRQFETVNTDLNGRINKSIMNTIDANIDPKESMTDYVRKTAAKDAMENLSTLMDKDTRFRALSDKLWEAAFKDNFSKASIDRIKQAYHSKARTLLPSVIKKARNDALRGTGKRVRDDDESTSNRSPVPAGKPRSQSPGKVREAKDIPKGMSTLDFLSSD